VIRAWGMAALILGLLRPLPAFAQTDDAALLYAALSESLDADANRPVPRLPRVAIDPSGDTTIVFAIRNEHDDASAIRDGAVSDTLTLLRTVYDTAPVDSVSSVTVLGTFPFKGTKAKLVRENPVLRAVLSAEHAHGLDWQRLTPADLPTTVDVWWLQGAFATVDDQLAEGPP
jgi:hypothetical protein